MQSPHNGTPPLCLAGLMSPTLKQGPASSCAADAAVPARQHLASQVGDLPVPNGGEQQTACLVPDIDKDGCNDIVGARTPQDAAVAAVITRRSFYNV